MGPRCEKWSGQLRNWNVYAPTQIRGAFIFLCLFVIILHLSHQTKKISSFISCAHKKRNIFFPTSYFSHNHPVLYAGCFQINSPWNDLTLRCGTSPTSKYSRLNWFVHCAYGRGSYCLFIEVSGPAQVNTTKEGFRQSSPLDVSIGWILMVGNYF